MASRIQPPIFSPPPFHLPPMPLSQDDLKRLAAHRAAELVESGMVVGLGSGSTASHFLHRLADLLRRGLLRDVVGIPTSNRTASLALSLGIPLSDLDSHPLVHLSVDGADEVDPHLNLVKGRGGSLLREKMIESASTRFVVIVDHSKIVPSLGASGLAVPVEIVPFCAKFTMGKLRRLFHAVPGFDLRLRNEAGDQMRPSVTDNSNYVVDLFFENGIAGDLNEIGDKILGIVGVVEHGMFLGMASSVIVAGRDGSVTVIDRMGDEGFAG